MRVPARARARTSSRSVYVACADPPACGGVSTRELCTDKLCSHLNPPSRVHLSFRRKGRRTPSTRPPESGVLWKQGGRGRQGFSIFAAGDSERDRPPPPGPRGRAESPEQDRL